jgi:bifunctional non-homologous end joining protein LigD
MLPAPMLATSGRVLRGDGWVVEPKLDGWRAMVQVTDRVTVRTRNGRDITDRLPELNALLSVLEGHSALLDGELVAGEGLPGDFYRLGPGLSSPRPKTNVTFAAFDLLDLDGEPLIGLPYTERRAIGSVGRR